MTTGRLGILLFCDETARHTGTVDDHINAIHGSSRHDVWVADLESASGLDVEIDRFDAIVVHYSVAHTLVLRLPDDIARRLMAFKGPKILFIQDEYRWVDATAEAIRKLGISVVFTVVNEDTVRKVYRHPWLAQVRFETTLTGFVPTALLSRAVPAYRDRPIDVSYRARKLSAWLGGFGQEKYIIGERFAAEAKRYGLACDIAMSESQRIYGGAWIDFVASSKAVLGTESGASFIDYGSDVQQQVETYEKQHPDATFETVRDLFLGGRDGETVIRVISPRCFEAAALRTLLILYPGTYSGALEAHRHYVVLERDHSNMDEVVAVLRDPVRAQKIIDAAYHEVACSPRWSFAALVEQLDRVVVEEHARLAGPQAQSEGRAAERSVYAADLLNRTNERAARRRQGLEMAVRLMRWSAAAAQSAERVLPASVTRRVQPLGRAAADRIKPTLKRLLLGRSS